MGNKKKTDPRTPSADAIRAARIAAGLDERAAAKLIHRNAAAWADWETGARPMDLALWELFTLKTGGRLP